MFPWLSESIGMMGRRSSWSLFSMRKAVRTSVPSISRTAMRREGDPWTKAYNDNGQPTLRCMLPCRRRSRHSSPTTKTPPQRKGGVRSGWSRDLVSGQKGNNPCSSPLESTRPFLDLLVREDLGLDEVPQQLHDQQVFVPGHLLDRVFRWVHYDIYIAPY